jgi:UPF0755 protein
MTKHRPNQRRLLYGLLAALPLVVVITGYIFYRLGLAPAADTGESREFTVRAGDNAPAIARHLEEAGLLRSRDAFVTYANLHGLRPRLKAGVYLIAPTMTGGEIAELLAGGRTATRRLTVPEGYRLSQIKEAASKVGIPPANFQAALDAPHGQAFLAGRPAGVSLEGYIFPDSYEINAGSSAGQLVEAMLDNFGRRVGPEYAQAFAAQGLNLHQGLTLASMVEREVNIPADRPIVAQIFLKRLRLGQSLGSDVTTHYAAELLGVPFDVNLNSPYNTRRVTGLPPGPICNPGLSSLDAVAKPATTDYLYFLTGRDGKTYYAKTYAEHQQNITRYLE